MDGYALGKTKVFLKYFHLEYLSKLYEKQIRKIIRVQAVVRRWLASLKVRIIKKGSLKDVGPIQKDKKYWLFHGETIKTNYHRSKIYLLTQIQ